MTQIHVAEDNEKSWLEEYLAHLEQQNKDEDVQEVLSQIGLAHPMTDDGYEISYDLRLLSSNEIHQVFTKISTAFYSMNFYTTPRLIDNT